MHQNIESAVSRGENLSDLHDRSDQLENDSRNFRVRSNNVRRRFCASYYRTMFLIFIIAACFIGIIVYFATN
jgi:hypothetical protein